MTKEEALKIAKPILFNTEMVRAILDGRKTATRRCVKLKYDNTHHEMKTDKYGTRLIEIQDDIEGETFGKSEDGRTWRKIRGYIEPKAPYRRGDILYVRETWTLEEFYDDEALVKFKAGGEQSLDYDTEGEIYRKLYKFTDDIWIPSIHMPKEAARIFLRVKGVRVERLQDITKDQILEEGTNRKEIISYINQMPEETEEYVITAFRCAFFQLWDSTIKKQDLDKYGWYANPWVWVIEFERIEVE